MALIQSGSSSTKKKREEKEITFHFLLIPLVVPKKSKQSVLNWSKCLSRTSHVWNHINRGMGKIWTEPLDHWTFFWTTHIWTFFFWNFFLGPFFLPLFRPFYQGEGETKYWYSGRGGMQSFSTQGVLKNLNFFKKHKFPST